jgi:predicted amidohydrolase
MKVALIQLGYGDDEPVAARTERVAALVRAQAGHDLVVLPELWSAGGFDYRRWAGAAEPLDGPTVTAVAKAAREAGATVHAGSIMERAADGDADRGPDGRGLWNTSVVLSPAGDVVATYRKIHRFGFAGGEPRLIEPGEQIVTVDVPTPAGDVRVGLATCYDLRFPEQFRLLTDAGASVFVVPAAWPARRVGHWSLLGRARAVENQAAVVQCNTAGTHAGTPMGGRSQVVDPMGDVVAEAGDGEQVLVADVDTGAIATWRAEFPVLADRRL